MASAIYSGVFPIAPTIFDEQGDLDLDGNRRALDDAALNAIRDQVRSTAAALREVHIEPGSPRALALFGG